MTVHYYDMIPQGAPAIHWAVSSAHYSETQASRVAYAISAIGIAIFDAGWYIALALAEREWTNITEAGRCLAFAGATMFNIYLSFLFDNVFAPPPVQIPKPPSMTSLLQAADSVPLEELQRETSLVLAPTVEVTHAPQALDFESFPMSQGEKDALGIIAWQLGTATIWSPPNPFTTMAAGKTVNDLHPLRFIAFFCSGEQVKQGNDLTFKAALKQIRYGGDGKNKSKIGLLWQQFVGPLSDSMEKQLKSGKILPYLESFSKKLGADHATVASFFDPLNCVGLVDYLLSL